MRKLLLSLLSVCAIVCTASAQFTNHVVTFDTLNLSKQDTFYVNLSTPGADVGFWDNDLYFPCVYDTGWGMSFWSSGFVFSNMTDSVTSGITNQYAAKTAKGFDTSDNYAVAYGASNIIRANSAGPKIWDGFYVTNSTYTYNSMRDSDPFAKKFGGASGNDPDWFKITVRRYLSGQLQQDSVDFYLADFRDTNNANDYIVNDWRWFGFGAVYFADSIQISVSSSDVGQWGMNTPAYFCLDNVSYKIISMGTGNAPATFSAKVYPNPATDQVFVEFGDAKIERLSLLDMTGRVLSVHNTTSGKLSVPVAHLPRGMYVLRFEQGAQTQSVRFLKQ